MEKNSVTSAESLLHPKISQLYRFNQQPSKLPRKLCINEEGVFDWGGLTELLSNSETLSGDDPIYPKSYTEYLPNVELLKPVLLESESVLARVSNKTEWLEKLQWLGQESRLPLILQEHCQPSSAVSSVENILFLTSALENALGNVYYSISKKSPPHLLRDLLDTKELKDTLGTCPIFFLKILMGSPESINLRNIVWHGFPLPHEIHPCFVSTLLIASASLSDKVKHIPLTSRQQVKDFSRFLAKIKVSSIDFALVESRAKVIKAIESSKWTGLWTIYWKQIYQHYEQQNYWRCTMLILPQIELVLRKIYGEVNNFDISAKLKEYYITMGSIFDSTDNNRLLDSFVDRETLHFLYDIFISPFGMRIRDKISHGEVELDCVDRELCSVLLYAGLNLLNRQEFPLNNYESKFHLNNLTHQAITASKTFVVDLTTISTPKGFGVEFTWNQEAIISLQKLTIRKPVEIFHRPKRETEIMTNVMRIAQLIVQVCQNYRLSFEERFGMFINHELRSRARKTLEKMVETLGVIAETLGTMVGYLIEIANFKHLDNDFEASQRFCKHTLTIVENLIRYSDKESNEWLKALDCCEKFRQIKYNFNLNFKFSSLIVN